MNKLKAELRDMEHFVAFARGEPVPDIHQVRQEFERRGRKMRDGLQTVEEVQTILTEQIEKYKQTIEALVIYYLLT